MFGELTIKNPQRNNRNMGCENCFLHLACFMEGCRDQFDFFGENLNTSKAVAFAQFVLLTFNLDHSTYT